MDQGKDVGTMLPLVSPEEVEFLLDVLRRATNGYEKSFTADAEIAIGIVHRRWRSAPAPDMTINESRESKGLRDSRGLPTAARPGLLDEIQRTVGSDPLRVASFLISAAVDQINAVPGAIGVCMDAYAAQRMQKDCLTIIDRLGKV